MYRQINLSNSYRLVSGCLFLVIIVNSLTSLWGDEVSIKATGVNSLWPENLGGYELDGAIKEGLTYYEAVKVLGQPKTVDSKADSAKWFYILEDNSRLDDVYLEIEMMFRKGKLENFQTALVTKEYPQMNMLESGNLQYGLNLSGKMLPNLSAIPFSEAGKMNLKISIKNTDTQPFYIFTGLLDFLSSIPCGMELFLEKEVNGKWETVDYYGEFNIKKDIKNDSRLHDYFREIAPGSSYVLNIPVFEPLCNYTDLDGDKFI